MFKLLSHSGAYWGLMENFDPLVGIFWGRFNLWAIKVISCLVMLKWPSLSRVRLVNNSGSIGLYLSTIIYELLQITGDILALYSLKTWGFINAISFEVPNRLWIELNTTLSLDQLFLTSFNSKIGFINAAIFELKLVKNNWSRLNVVLSSIHCLFGTQWDYFINVVKI